MFDVKGVFPRSRETLVFNFDELVSISFLQTADSLRM